jgi:REP element-mobilizing transposase RayT
MGRTLRIQLPGGLYHVFARGNARAAIFDDDADYATNLGMLTKTIKRFDWLCHSFCLMPNHFHLLLETPEPNLAAGMHVLNLSYARYFNWRYRRVGHLFQGPYKSIAIRDDDHFLEVTRYLALNPVRAGLVTDPADWRWTSFRATAGTEAVPEFLQTDRVRSFFRSQHSSGGVEFAAFVREPLLPLRLTA